MSNAVTTKTFESALGLAHDIRVVTIDGEPWFVAVDVCRALDLLPGTDGGYQRHLLRVNDDERRNHLLPTNSICGVPGLKRFGIVSESGLYKLVLGSRKPEARAFQDWVTRIVLPSIRKHGGYVAGQEKVATGEMSNVELLARAALVAQSVIAEVQAENARLTAKVETLAPKAAVADAHFATNRLVPLTRFARTLEGVNVNAIKGDLMRLGYLWRPGTTGAYRVRAAYRNTMIVEKRDPVYLKLDLYLTAAGQQLVAEHFANSDLTMLRTS